MAITDEEEFSVRHKTSYIPLISSDEKVGMLSKIDPL